MYARDALDTARTYHLVNGVEIHVQSVDVERKPEDVLAQVDALARSAAGVDALSATEAGTTRSLAPVAGV